jgi:hypothetical protein
MIVTLICLQLIMERSTLFVGVRTRDPKGMLPTWVVNIFQKEWTLTTLIAIRKQTSKSDVKVDYDLQNF